MSLIKWEPFDDFDRLFRDLSALPALRQSGAGYDLSVDLYEDGNNLVAEMNIPGLEGDDIDIEIEDNHLRVSGRREEVKEKKEKSHYTKEIHRGSFQRVVALPDQVDQDNVDATYEHGVLKVVMPKKHEKKEKRIKVKVTKK